MYKNLVFLAVFFYLEFCILLNSVFYWWYILLHTAVFLKNEFSFLSFPVGAGSSIVAFAASSVGKEIPESPWYNSIWRTALQLYNTVCTIVCWYGRAGREVIVPYLTNCHRYVQYTGKGRQIWQTVSFPNLEQVEHLLQTPIYFWPFVGLSIAPGIVCQTFLSTLPKSVPHSRLPHAATFLLPIISPGVCLATFPRRNELGRLGSEEEK